MKSIVTKVLVLVLAILLCQSIVIAIDKFSQLLLTSLVTWHITTALWVQWCSVCMSCSDDNVQTTSDDCRESSDAVCVCRVVTTMYKPRLTTVCRVLSTTDAPTLATSPGLACTHNRPSDAARAHCLHFSVAHLTTAPQPQSSLMHSSTITHCHVRTFPLSSLSALVLLNSWCCNNIHF